MKTIKNFLIAALLCVLGGFFAVLGKHFYIEDTMYSDIVAINSFILSGICYIAALSSFVNAMD